jgi:DNA-binding protein H-NS
MELNGEVIEWTGRGRRPKAFEGVELQKYLAK